MVLGVRANPAYDDASKWLKGTSTVAEPWRRRPTCTADSNLYHGAGLLKAKRTLPHPPYEEEPVYEKILAECEDDEDYVPMLLATGQSGNPNLQGLSLSSPLEAETLQTTFSTLDPKNQIPMPAEPDEGNSSLLDPSADINSMKFDAEHNMTYEGRKNWTGNGEHTSVGSAEASTDHGDCDIPHSCHNSNAAANYLPPNLESRPRKIMPTRDVEQQVPVNTTHQQVATGQSFRH